jgi:hypothetical protein
MLHLSLSVELSHANTISTTGIDDGTLYGWSELTNTTSQSLSVQNGLEHSGEKGDISVLEFDISPISLAVSNATLNLYFNNIGSGGQADLYLNHYVNDGDGVVTFISDYSAPTETVELVPNVMTYIYDNNLTGEIWSFDITAYLNNDISSGFNYSSYQLMLTKNPTSNSTLFFASADHSSLPAPYIEYTVVPVPGALLLFGSGLIGLIGLARRKQSVLRSYQYV